MEITFWNAVKDAKTKDLLQTYLDRYPAGNFTGLAKVLSEQLGMERNATRVAIERPHYHLGSASGSAGDIIHAAS